MKNMLLFIFLLAVSLEARSQAYQPFPDSGAVWRENGADYSGAPNDVTHYFYELSLSGDTTIGLYIYHNLNADGFGMERLWSNGNWYGPFTVSLFSCCYGAIREDIQKKIYYYDYFTATETLLYDFNLTIGDTLPLSYINDANSTVVTGIDSILISGQYHKRFQIDQISNPGYPVYYIEGVGSTTGLLGGQLHITQPPFEIYSYLVCFTVDGSHNLIDSLGSTLSDCDLPDGIASPQTKTIAVSIFPNPVSDLMMINTNGSIEKILVTDLTGKIMIENNFAPSKQTLFKSVLDVSSLSPGIYIVEVRDKVHAGRSLFIRQ